MERRYRVEMWAAGALLVLCGLIGVVEGATVLAAGSWPVFLPWLVAFLGYLGGLYALVVRTPATRHGLLLLVAAPVLAGSAVVLLSANRGGLSLILLVITAGASALQLSIRGIALVVGWHSLVVVAMSLGMGPLVDEASPSPEPLVAALLYGLLQGASAAMTWSGQRVEEALEDLSVAHVELRSTSALLAESSQAAERLRISRELHDVLGHQLTVLSVELEVASHRVQGPGREHVLRARGMTKELLADVRSVVGAERGRSFDLAAALARIVEDIPRPRVHVDIEPGLAMDDLPAAVVVRVVQEVATNTIRHAQAENLWISLTQQDGEVRLETQDDGTGTARVVPGNGLTGLRERVESVGGRVELDGSSGFRVHAALPARLEVAA